MPGPSEVAVRQYTFSLFRAAGGELQLVRPGHETTELLQAVRHLAVTTAVGVSEQKDQADEYRATASKSARWV